jgi:hypothetical protein
MLAFFAAGNLYSQVENIVTITATALGQNNNSTNNGTVTTTSVPHKYTLGTKQILAFLAQAEFREMKYGSPAFPSGAKLMAIGAPSSPVVTFQVWDKNDHTLVDVSDIITSGKGGFSGSGDCYGSNINSGKQSNNTHLSSPTQTFHQMTTLFYNDISTGGSLQFYLTGLMTSTSTATAPIGEKPALYKETQTNKCDTAAGDGNYLSNPMVITGGFTAAGSGMVIY